MHPAGLARHARSPRGTFVALGTVGVLAAGLLSAAPGTAGAVSSARTPGAAPTSATAGQPTVLTSGDGRVRLLGAAPGRTLSAAPSGARGLVAAARAQLRVPAAKSFGLATASDLRAAAVSHAPSGHDVVRFQQIVDGVPVVGGQLVSVLDPEASLVSVTGELSRAVRSTSYDIAASAAARTARRATARARHLRVSTVRAARPTRASYDASLVEPGGRPGARAVWQVEVTARHRLDVRELVLVDAARGSVALRVDQVARVLDRVVCDRAGRASGDEACKAGGYTRVEGQPATGIADVDQAYDLTGATATWFAQHVGIDLTDLIGSDHGDGRKLRSTTRYCGPAGCPLDNAFWTGDQMVYGTGYAGADDVVAHELSHGVSQRVAGLIYWFQSGAINESMSDVFGELVDLGDGVGNDAPEVRWQLGEDLSPSAGGVARDMAHPTAYGQPDHTGSELYDFAPDYDDSGGVHTNSGVPNKTAYLIADGTTSEPAGAFNGQSFAGIGTDKTALVYWSALALLTPGADFTDLAAALQQACSNLAAVGTGGVVAADCGPVAGAVAATGLTRWAGPGVPRDVRMKAGPRAVRVRWTPPAASGSSPLSSYAIWARPDSGVDDFIALEPTARSYIVSGLRPGVDYTIGLVAVTADGTSQPVTRRFRGSALAVRWPASVTYGDPLRVRGVLSSGGRSPVPGETVRLWRRYRGASAYREIARARTSGNGGFLLRARPRPSGPASYLVTFDAIGRTLGARTPAQRIAVRQRVTLVANPSLRRGGALAVRGAVVPARSGAPVWLQRQRADGSWRTVLRERLDRAGRYDLRLTGARARRGVWRVLVPKRGGSLAAGISREVTVRR